MRTLRLLLALATAILVPASLDARQEVKRLPAEIHEPTRCLNREYLIQLPGKPGEGGRAPLLIFLHGRGERGNSIETIRGWGPRPLLENPEESPFIIVSPQCLKKEDGRGWWRTADLVLLLEHLKRTYPVDPERIYLTGLSMGGFATWAWAVHAPHEFAAIAPICGRGQPERAERIRHLPVWAFHGDEDSVVPPSGSRDMVEALEKAGSTSARLTIYEGVNHNSWDRAYGDEKLYAWFLSHRRITAPESAEKSLSWTGWRGPRRDARADHFEVPEKWPEKLRRVWNVKVGEGYATPLVDGEKIYVHARQGEEEVFWCLDLETGEEIWKKSEEVPFKIGGGGELHGKGPKSSPVLADGRLFTLSITGIVSARSASDGELLWRSELGTRFGKGHPYWGSATSPIVDGERLIVHLGDDERGALYALDVEDGSEIWKQGEDGTCYSSPLVTELEGVRQVIEWNHRALVGVDVESGRKLWEFPFPHRGTDQNMPTPVVHRGRVILGGENRGLLSVMPRREGDDWKVEEVWRRKDVALDMSSAVIRADALYGLSHYGRGRIFSLDPATGELHWQGPARTGENVAFLSIPGHVVALTDSGELRIVEATPGNYRVAASYRVSEQPTWTTPVLLRKRVLIKDVDTLTLWSF